MATIKVTAKLKKLEAVKGGDRLVFENLKLTGKTIEDLHKAAHNEMQVELAITPTQRTFEDLKPKEDSKSKAVAN